MRQPMSMLDLQKDRHIVYSSETASGEWCGCTLAFATNFGNAGLCDMVQRSGS
jgi:hypothetical protein